MQLIKGLKVHSDPMHWGKSLSSFGPWFLDLEWAENQHLPLWSAESLLLDEDNREENGSEGMLTRLNK